MRTLRTAFCFCFTPLIVLKKYTWQWCWVVSFSPSGYQRSNTINWGSSYGAKRSTQWGSRPLSVTDDEACGSVCSRRPNIPRQGSHLKRHMLPYCPVSPQGFPSRFCSPTVSWLSLGLSQKKTKSANINCKLEPNFRRATVNLSTWKWKVPQLPLDTHPW